MWRGSGSNSTRTRRRTRTTNSASARARSASTWATTTYLGAAATDAALDLLSAWGVERVETHVRGLAADLASRLLDLGLPVVGGTPGPHLAHIVSVGESGGGRHYTADDPAMNALHDHLTAAGIRLAIRTGMLRFSIGVYNDKSDIDRIVKAARSRPR